MSLKVYRPHVSPYQNPHFRKWEKEALEAIEGVVYLDSPSEIPQILLTNTHFNYDSFLHENPHIKPHELKLIVHPNSGYDNFPKDLIKQLETPIILGNPVRSQAVANYVLSCIFEQFTAIPQSKKWDPLRLWPRETLQEKHVLIIGYGHIGSILNLTLRPLTKKVTLVDPYKNLPSLEEAPLEKADILILTCGLNLENRGLLSEEQFKRMKKDILIINPARGKLIKESDLMDFLAHNPKSYAYLDVFEKEPIDYQKFKGLKNIHLTPHIAGVFENLDHQIIKFETEVLQKYIEFKNKTFNFFHHYQDLLLKNKMKQGIII